MLPIRFYYVSYSEDFFHSWRIVSLYSSRRWIGDDGIFYKDQFVHLVFQKHINFCFIAANKEETHLLQQSELIEMFWPFSLHIRI